MNPSILLGVVLVIPSSALKMSQQRAVRFQGDVGDVLGRLTEQQLQERETNAAAAALLREYNQYEGPAEDATQKKARIGEGYKAKQRHQEKRLLLEDSNAASLGSVLKGQTLLIRREMFRKRLFPIRFDDAARNVDEAQDLLLQRPPVVPMLVAFFYVSMLLLFLSFALDITTIFEAADGIRSPLYTTVAPTPSNFNAISYEISKAQQANQTPTVVAATPATGRPADIMSLQSKESVTSWILHGFIPLLYGASPQTNNLGFAKVLGNCFRLTFRQVELQEVVAFDLGYEGVWPLSGTGAASSISSVMLRSDNPLTSPPSSRFTYSYPFAAAGEDKAFNQKGGYYQVICADSAAKAQEALQQAQPVSRYPPWFVPTPAIADRRTISAVVDFFVVNPLLQTFSHCAVLFAFTSAGTVQRPLIWVSSLIASSSETDRKIVYVSLSLMLVLLAVYLCFEYKEAKTLGFKNWFTESWTILLLFHLFVLACCLASFTAVQVIARHAPKIEATLADNGYYEIPEGPMATNETGFFQLVSDYDSLFYANAAAQEACVVFGSLAAVTGCLLVAKLFLTIAGVRTKSLQMTFRKVKYYLLTCTVGMLAILLIFVSFGNISFGAATSSFTGYDESLTSSAAFLLGGTLGNYDVYDMVSLNPVLSGMFFVPLFLMLSVFGFTILTAVVLRKHDTCDQSVEQNVMKHKLEEKALFRTRYEWLRHTVAQSWREFWDALCNCREKERLELPDNTDNSEFEDDLKEFKELKESEKQKKGLRKRKKKKGKDYYTRNREEEAQSSAEEYFDSPPQYPPWVWQAMGIEDPFNIYSTQPGWQQQGFYVDPASMAGYSSTYGYFSGFGMNGAMGQWDCYFTPQIVAATIPSAPAPSVPKVYILARNQMQKDHEDAWKKLFVVAFVGIILATVSLQLTIETAADMRKMVDRAVSKTSFPLDPVQLTCKDLALGLPDVNATISFPAQVMFGIRTPRDLYSWLVADPGLMAFLDPATDSSLFGEAFPRLTMSNGGAYKQSVISNWNSTVATRSVRVILTLREEAAFPTQLGFTCKALECEYQPFFEPTAFKDFLKKLVAEDILRDVASELKFHIILLNVNQGNTLSEVYISFSRNRGGTISPILSIEAFNLQPYGSWSTNAVAAIALQVASVSLFLFFGCSFFVEFHRLRNSLKEEREDFSCGLCLGVFFVDDLFNLFDVIGFGVLGCSIAVWVLHVLASPHSQVFNLAEDLAAAAAAAAAGSTQETEATKAAAEFFSSFSSTAALLRAYAQLAAAILAVAFLRLLRIGRKRRSMTLMFFTLAGAAEEILQVLAGTTLVFIGFSYLSFLSFGRQVEEYSTIKSSFISTFLLTIGYFPLSELFQADPGMAGAFIFPYLFFVGIICFSFFLCVLFRSLAYRTAEIKTMERLSKIEKRSLLESLQLFFWELSCKGQPSGEEIQKKQKELELQQLQQQENEATAFGKRTASDQWDDFNELQEIENAERRRRERPLKVVEMPSDVVTSALSDEQYAALPEEARLFANQEVVSFVDRFRLMETQFRLGSGDIPSLLQKLANEAYTELTALSRDVAQQECHLQHELSVYTSQVVGGQLRLTAYIKFLEHALEEREEELQIQKQELMLLEAKLEEVKQEAERYGRRR